MLAVRGPPFSFSTLPAAQRWANPGEPPGANPGVKAEPPLGFGTTQGQPKKQPLESLSII